jgi:hypothetical protein
MLKQLTALVIFAALLFIAACSSDDNSVNNPSTPTLTGTWKLNTYALKTMGVTTQTVTPTTEMKMTFNADSTCTGDLISFLGSDVSGSGTYSVSGNNMTITSSGSKETNYTFIMTGNNLTMTESGSMGGFSMSVDMKFTK